MLTFEKIKQYYDAGAWSAEMVQKAVVKGKITAEQASQILSGGQK
ncbi:XkdX family protein [Acidaminobacterium chupaoyuni]